MSARDPSAHPWSIRIAIRSVAIACVLLPRAERRRFGRDVVGLFEAIAVDAHEDRGASGVLLMWGSTLLDLAGRAVRGRLRPVMSVRIRSRPRPFPRRSAFASEVVQRRFGGDTSIVGRTIDLDAGRTSSWGLGHPNSLADFRGWVRETCGARSDMMDCPRMINHIEMASSCTRWPGSVRASRLCKHTLS